MTMTTDHHSPNGANPRHDDDTAQPRNSDDDGSDVGLSASSTESVNLDRDVLNERRERYREIAEEEIAIWMDHCKRDPDYWDLFGSILKDERSARIRLGSWRGMPIALNDKSIRFNHFTGDESSSTSEEEAPIRPGVALHNTTRKSKDYRPNREKLRARADWLRNVMAGSSIQKKSKENTKTVKARKEQIAKDLESELKKAG